MKIGELLFVMGLTLYQAYEALVPNTPPFAVKSIEVPSQMVVCVDVTEEGSMELVSTITS